MHTTTRHSTLWFVLLIACIALALSACEARLARNDDGSYTFETTISEADMQAAIKASLADPLIQELNVDLKEGYILASGTRKRLNSDRTDTLTFRLDLGVSAGQLTAAISNALLDGIPVEAERVALWNERIANRLGNAGSRNPNSKLQTVVVTESSATLTWRIEPK